MSLLKTNEIQNYNGSSLTLTASTVSTSAQLNTGGNISVTGSLNVSDESTTRTNLGLGTIATQDSDSITVTGGTATLGALTVSGSDSGDLVRITQTGTGNALVVEDEANPDSTPFVVDSGGKVIAGSQSAIAYSSSLSIVPQVQQNTLIATQLGISRFSSGSAGAPSLVFLKTRGPNIGDFGIVQNGDDLGKILFLGGDGSDGILAADISAEVDGTPGTNDMPGRLVFSTTADGASSSTERMRINSSGALILAGSTAQKATGTTWSNPSDQRLKSNISDYPKGTAELMQVRVREWEYNGKGGTVAGTKGLGVIADEIMTVLPNTVDNYEAKLNVDDEETTQIKKFDATEITWLLVKTTQEQQALIESQQSQIDALTARIETLETS